MIRLTATASSSVDATGYRIQILNADTGTVITNCGGTVCKGAEPVAWSENANPLEHHYLARVRDYADTDTAASSSQVTVTVRPYDFAPVLTAERYSVAPRNLIRLSATTSRSVDGTGYRIQIVNTDTGSVVTNCGGSSCSGAEWVEWAENANPGQHHYLARVQTYGGDDTAGTSGPITVNVHQQRFGLALSVSSTTGSDGAKRYTVTATSDRSVDATGYAIKLRDDHHNVLASCGGTTCTAYGVAAGSAVRATVEDYVGRIFGASYWWQLSADDATELRSGNVDLFEAAASFASASAVCDAIMGWGTHFARSTLSDEYFACTSAAEAGATTPETLLRIAALAGAGGIASFLIWYSREQTGNPPNAAYPPPPPSSSDPAPSRLAPDPFPPGFAWEDLAAGLAARNPEVAAQLADPASFNAVVKTTAQECLAMLADAGYSLDLCSKLPIFSSGSDVEEATDWDLAALARHPEWHQLTYASKGPNPGWYKDFRETEPEGRDKCTAPGSGLDCHEFPYWATEQGGPTADPFPWLKLIPSDPNQDQGRKFGNFVTACKMSQRLSDPAAGGGDFLDIPTTPSLGIPTLRWCNGNPA